MDHLFRADEFRDGQLRNFMPAEEAALTPFANGDRVIVRIPDGSGYVMNNVRVVWVDGRTGAQEVEADSWEPFDIEAIAEDVPDTRRRLLTMVSEALAAPEELIEAVPRVFPSDDR